MEEDLSGSEDVLLEELVEAAEDQDHTDGLTNYSSAIEALLEAVQMNVLVLLDRSKKTLLWGKVIRETIRFVQAFLPLFSFSISLRHILFLSRHFGSNFTFLLFQNILRLHHKELTVKPDDDKF